MYVYLYDQFLRNKKYLPILKAIEVRLTDHGIAGKIIRLNNYTDAKGIIEEEIKRGAKTIVITGNDDTFGAVLSRSANLPCTFGFLPVGGNNSIAEILGIPTGADACDVLSKRRLQELDVGWMNGRYFIGQLRVHPAPVEVCYDERFVVSAKDRLEVVVCNLKPFYWTRATAPQAEQVVHPQDRKLEAFLRPLTKKRWWGYTYEEPSIFPFEHMTITAREPFTVEADGKLSKEVKLTIKLANYRAQMIVGRNRKF